MRREVDLVKLRAKLDEFKRDDLQHYRTCVRIKDHNTSRIVPLTLNTSQMIIRAVANKQLQESGRVRCLVLKSRRVGASTYIEARFYRNATLHTNHNAFIVAHEEDSTATLFRMARLMQERNPYAPQTRYSSAQELVFDTPSGKGHKSEYRLATAKNVDAGRAQGLHDLHGSEVSVWPDAEQLLSGLLQAIPPPPAHTEVFLESTAKGYGNYFQREVFSCYAEGRYPYYVQDGITYAWRSPDSDYVLIFIPWFVHELYTMPFETDTEREAFGKSVEAKVFDRDAMQWVDSKAKVLRDRFNLTLEQLHWRQWCIDNNCQHREEIFEQEYPSTVEEAFLSQGLNYFGRQLCDQVEADCREPILRGEVVERAGVPKISPSQYGKFVIWQKPDRDETVFLTVDSAGGVTQSQADEQREPDPTCIEVWSLRTGEQWAQWHGHIDYDMIGELVERIGRLYARKVYDDRGVECTELPTACVEMNNHGHAVIADLSRLKYPLYEHKPSEAGWLTDKRTRPEMLSSASAAVRDGRLQVRCRETVSEMRTFVEHKGGRFEAESGCHDERVMTLGMAARMMELIPRYAHVGNRDRDVVRIGAAMARGRRKPYDGRYQEVRVNV